jgi:hypothetical protein
MALVSGEVWLAELWALVMALVLGEALLAV